MKPVLALRPGRSRRISAAASRRSSPRSGSSRSTSPRARGALWSAH